MKRSELRAVAQTKLDDALLLLAHKRYSNAYYLAGYAIEIALKACISRQITADVIPDKAFINAIHTHQLKDLVGVAGLNGELRAKEVGDAEFSTNWALVRQWHPEKRYSSIDSYSAETMLHATNDQKAGVFPWIQTYW
ncbi:hypothetical protein [Phenylobacterium sp.]|uniref:hypothetical protein n=1 Tax=Phenylobacterium sp. TaxID=1871053 RepID=UPI0027374085|nr:hypothetical protein [Phenylobacterium sp.]MDP3633586.1 hypothetical protein [Phenylobacterium sp.]MDZ4052650.1 hypothetical protein [Phenylobacterium sp.]